MAGATSPSTAAAANSRRLKAGARIPLPRPLNPDSFLVSRRASPAAQTRFLNASDRRAEPAWKRGILRFLIRVFAAPFCWNFLRVDAFTKSEVGGLLRKRADTER
jgi:hypothetical protein